MNRKLAVGAAAVLAASILTGCSKTTGTTHDVELGPQVMHPNMLVIVKCDENKHVAVTTLLITGTSDPSRQPIFVTPTTPAVNTGFDCYFRLKAKSGSDLFVTANLADGGSLWYFGSTLTAKGLNMLNKQKVVPGVSKGGEYRIYVQVNSLPLTDSFDSRQNWSGGGTAKGVKNYNRRVAQMNALKLNKLAGITYAGYGV